MRAARVVLSPGVPKGGGRISEWQTALEDVQKGPGPFWVRANAGERSVRGTIKDFLIATLVVDQIDFDG
jgi:hypothetical protein